MITTVTNFIVKHQTTKERIAAFCDKNDKLEDIKFYETDWGKPRGKEIW